MSIPTLNLASTSRGWLDKEYNVRTGIPDHEDIFASWAQTSAEVRAKSQVRTFSYGADEAQAYDLFLPSEGPGNAPVLVFVHGGYWQSLDKNLFSYLAPAYTARGIAFAAVNYRLAPSVSMDDIVADVRASIVDIARRSSDVDIDPTRIFVSGHSAGGHLAAMMLATDWVQYSLPENLVKGACAVSGLYDLEPISQCYLNEKIGMTADVARRNSPVHLRPNVRAPLVVTYGGDESGEFDRQQGEIVRLWTRYCSSIIVIGMQDGHHFDAVDRLADDTGLHRAVLALIQG